MTGHPTRTTLSECMGVRVSTEYTAHHRQRRYASRSHIEATRHPSKPKTSDVSDSLAGERTPSCLRRHTRGRLGSDLRLRMARIPGAVEGTAGPELAWWPATHLARDLGDHGAGHPAVRRTNGSSTLRHAAEAWTGSEGECVVARWLEARAEHIEWSVSTTGRGGREPDRASCRSTCVPRRRMGTGESQRSQRSGVTGYVGWAMYARAVRRTLLCPQ